MRGEEEREGAEIAARAYNTESDTDDTDYPVEKLTYVEHRYSDGTIKRITDPGELDYYQETLGGLVLFAHVHGFNPFEDRPVTWEKSKATDKIVEGY